MDDHYGNIYINFATPISLQKYINDININEDNNETRIISTIAHEIIYR
jgi:glycerol-3-phosphate O-acyltransferase